MTSIPEPKIIDVTVSEGGFRVNHNLLPQQVADLARETQRSNLRYMEVCHGIGIGSYQIQQIGLCSDKELLLAAKEEAPDLKYCVYVPPLPHSLKELENLNELFDIGRVKVNIDDPLKSFDQIKKIKSYKKTVIAQLLRIHLKPPEQSADAAKKLEDLGADVLILTDNFGSMSPEEVGVYIDAVKSEVKIPLRRVKHTI